MNSHDELSFGISTSTVQGDTLSNFKFIKPTFPWPSTKYYTTLDQSCQQINMTDGIYFSIGHTKPEQKSL